MQRHRADWVWTTAGPVRGGEVTISDQGLIAKVRAAHTTGAEAQEHNGIMLPGMVNAHTHLELSDLRGRIPGGHGLSSWAQTLLSRRRSPDDEAIRGALEEAFEAGTAAIIDVTNSGAALPQLVDSPMHGLGQLELLGIEADRCDAAMDSAARLMLAPGLPVRPTCHAVVSCAEDLLTRVLSPPVGPAPVVTFHCDEDPADTELLQSESGPWADFLDRLGRQWRGRIGRAESPVRLLDGLGLLGDHIALVHCVHTNNRDLDRIAASGTSIVLCPRSNLHIGGTLPDVAAMVSRRIPLAIGTDSLASADDMDLLKEAAVLAAAFPQIDKGVWLIALTSGGARLLDAPNGARGDGHHSGGLVAGGRHGLLLVDIPKSEDPLGVLLDGTTWPRRWLCPPAS